MGLLNVTLSDGSLLIQGKKITGFTNEEERQAQLDEYVPYLPEDELRKRGVVFVQADAPWASFAVEDRRVITGQNPASGGAVADLLIQAIGRP